MKLSFGPLLLPDYIKSSRTKTKHNTVAEGKTEKRIAARNTTEVVYCANTNCMMAEVLDGNVTQQITQLKQLNWRRFRDEMNQLFWLCPTCAEIHTKRLRYARRNERQNSLKEYVNDDSLV